MFAFYVFYGNYLKLYLSEKIESKSEVTIEYINEVIEKQTLDDIDNIFSDTEIEFFELLENSNGKIELDKQKNVDIVLSYLVKSGVSPKYIEEIIPSDNWGEIVKDLQDKETPEYRFLNRLTTSIIITNLVALLILVILISIFVGRTILPIKEITNKIRKLKPGSTDSILHYKKRDEVGLLINAINGLNKKLNIQKTIRSRLLADISHELKTPITSIQCYLEGISDGVIKLDKKNLAAITEEMSRLISLVNRIMNYERFENQKLELNLENKVLGDLIKEVVETHKKNLKENKQRVKVTGDENLEKSLDKNLFKQVIHNIVGNFLKYAGIGTLLTINITKNYIDFKDNGAGIKSSEIPFLTEKFYQGNSAKTGDAKKRGIGVGLSLVQKIIDEHNWRLDIKSEIGKGFSFKIYF
ncbi:MAG: HAMP domain-containing sensor histidine kinase [Candidatus Gracilibacteria bacterium]|nr:HAMP domain-containing sensor histidine kinase [Candidatus Gracilibacteria bacterium]